MEPDTEELDNRATSRDGDTYLNYAMVTEGIVMLFSAIIVGYASYYFVALGPVMSSLTFGAATVAALVASVLLFVAGAATEGSIIGQSHKIEGVSEFIVLCLIVVVMAAGSSLLVYRENFTNVKENRISSSLDNTVLTYSLAVFHECCSLENELPSQCGLTPRFPCYEDQAKFNEFLGKAPCGLLRVAGQVSAVDPESCANQELVPFVGSFMDFLKDETTKFGATVTALGVIMLLLSLGASVCMYFTYVDDYESEYKDTGMPITDKRLKDKFDDPEVMDAAKNREMDRMQGRGKKGKKKADYERNPNPHNLPPLSEEMEALKKETGENEEQEGEGREEDGNESDPGLTEVHVDT